MTVGYCISISKQTPRPVLRARLELFFELFSPEADLVLALEQIGERFTVCAKPLASRAVPTLNALAVATEATPRLATAGEFILQKRSPFF